MYQAKRCLRIWIGLAWLRRKFKLGIPAVVDVAGLDAVAIQQVVTVQTLGDSNHICPLHHGTLKATINARVESGREGRSVAVEDPGVAEVGEPGRPAAAKQQRDQGGSLGRRVGHDDIELAFSKKFPGCQKC